MQGCEYTAYHKLARSDPDFGGGGSSSVWVYLNQHEGDNSKCTSWAQDCCASLWWGEAQTCADGYVAVKVAVVATSVPDSTGGAAAASSPAQIDSANVWQ